MNIKSVKRDSRNFKEQSQNQQQGNYLYLHTVLSSAVKSCEMQKRAIRNWLDAGKEVFSTGGCRTGIIQVRSDAGQERCRTGEM